MVGTTIGSYRILARLGEGGMGVVYKALDLRLQRHVALKVLPPGASSDEQRRRFLQEARAASALNDPHIITIHDVLSEAGTQFLVMEFVEGRTLRQVIDAGPVGIDQALSWCAEIAGALGIAHAAGIVHRDLKPANVMVTARGLVKVLDFGIAKVAQGGDEETAGALTRVGDVMGTAEYMSPEQARGASVDHRTDIFSLGAILYELLTGTRAFQGANTFALLHAILHDPVPAASARRPEATAAVDAIVRKALERDVASRYQTMDAMAADLRAAMSGAAVTASATMPATTGSRRRRGAMRAAAAAAIVALAAAGIAWNNGWIGGAASRKASAMPAAAVIEEPTTAFQHTQAGLGRLQRFDRTGNIDQAIKNFEAAIAIDATNAPAWAGLSRALWRQQRATRDTALAARALDAARQAIALDPYLAAAHVSLGLAHLAASESGAAAEAFERALMLDPNSADAHRGKGDLAQAASKPADAAAAYATAVSLNPADWELPRLAGDIPYRAGRYADAKAWYEKAAAAAPDAATPFRLVGAANHMLGDYAGAAAAFQTSIAIQPTSSAYANLGTALFFQGRFRDALPAFEKALEMQPADPLSWGNAADAYRWVPGHREKSAEAYRRAIQLLEQQLAKTPTQVQARSRLALFLAKSGAIPRALVEVERAMAGGEPDVNTLYRAAVTYELGGRRDAALASLERALARGYALLEVKNDPELTNLRTDVRYHRLAARFEVSAPQQP